MSRLSSVLFSVAVVAVLLASVPASAQPYSQFLGLKVDATHDGYVAVPASSDFNFTTSFTFEAWVRVTDSGGCSSITGKRYTSAWWIGVCGTTLRSYIKGSSSLFDGGKIPANTWTHVAVTYDGTTRRHYIDGEEVAVRADTGAMGTNTDEIRIGSDTAWDYHPVGFIDEVRFWNVVRSKSEIRSTISSSFSTPLPGLVAVYHFDGSANDAVGGHNGALKLTAGYFFDGSCPACCVANATTLCFGGGRFEVKSTWKAEDGTSGDGKVVPGASADSGLFWFFAPTNWEVLVKQLDACSLNNRRWVFAAATTNQHFQLIVTDLLHAQTKRYISYFGPPAPAITDTDAFATCP
jgi:hypothetical protein